MAVHQPATIVPELELLRARSSHPPWFGGADTSTLIQSGAYRFDDPGGDVGIETHPLGTADGRVLQVPLTYRGAPRTSILTGGRQADLFMATDAGLVRQTVTTHVRGSGSLPVSQVPGPGRPWSPMTGPRRGCALAWR